MDEHERRVMSWSEMSEDDFRSLPEPESRMAQREMWRPIMDALAAGKTVRIDTSTEQESQRKTRSVIRRGLLRGFQVEVRKGEGFLAVQKTGDLAEPVRAGRRKKAVA